MIQSKIHDKSFEIAFDKLLESGTLNGSPFQWDVIRTGPSTYHVILNHRSFTIQVDGYDEVEHSFQLQVNTHKMRVSTFDQMQLLLKSMGLEGAGSQKLNEVKAPMPGLVLRVLVEEGQEVKKGDSLIVLEAMKMENMIKSPGDGKVSKIRINPGQAVEKNQVLIQFA